MQSISRILVPTDFSDRSLGMMPYVKAFSKAYNAEVVLLHVVDPIYVIPDTGISPPALLPVPQWLIERRTAELQAFASADLEGLPVRRLIYEGEPESQIAATAKAEGAGLVIMSTHGRGVFRRFLIGSVAAKVLYDVDCPVLTGTHSQEHAHADPANISVIVCSIGLGPQSQAVLASAVALANVFHARLKIVHVVPRWDPKLRGASSDLTDQLREVVKTEIANMRPALAFEDSEISVEEGEIGESVSRFAKASSADLVLVGRGSDTGQADAIIRHAPSPVLSIPPAQ